MKPRPLPALAVFALLLFAACGGGSDGDSEVAEAAAIAQGNNSDLDEFLEDYEEFVDEYCEFTERFATASLTEMTALAEDMSATGVELAQYSTRAVALKASASEEAQRRLDQMNAKVEECGAKLSR
jgi:hypothetical protein